MVGTSSGGLKRYMRIDGWWVGQSKVTGSAYVYVVMWACLFYEMEALTLSKAV